MNHQPKFHEWKSKPVPKESSNEWGTYSGYHCPQFIEEQIRELRLALPERDEALGYAKETISQFQTALTLFSDKAKWVIVSLVSLLSAAGGVAWLAFGEDRSAVQFLILVSVSCSLFWVARSVCDAASTMLRNYYDLYAACVVWAAFVHRAIGVEAHPWCEYVWRNIHKLTRRQDIEPIHSQEPADKSRLTEPDKKPEIWTCGVDGIEKSPVGIIVDVWRTTRGTTLSRYLTAINRIKALAWWGISFQGAMLLVLLLCSWSDKELSFTPKRLSQLLTKSEPTEPLVVRVEIGTNYPAGTNTLLIPVPVPNQK